MRAISRLSPQAKAYLALLVLAFIWGYNWVAMREFRSAVQVRRSCAFQWCSCFESDFSIKMLEVDFQEEHPLSNLSEIVVCHWDHRGLKRAMNEPMLPETLGAVEMRPEAGVKF